MGCGSSQAQELPQGSLIQSEEAEAPQGSLHQPEETVERHEPREIPSEDSRLGRNNFFCSEEDSNQNQSANGDGDLESTGNPSMTKISNEEEVNSSKDEFAVLRNDSWSKWPIRNFNKIGLNVNAGNGGGACLVQVSNSYGGGDAENTAGLFLFRCGYDSNHSGYTLIDKCHHGHFGEETAMGTTDEQGNLVIDCMFGTNHISLISNMRHHGNLSHGVVFEIPTGEDEVCVPLSVNGGSGGGAGVLLCSGWKSGANEATFMTALYLIRLGAKANKLQVKCVRGQDSWTFGFNSDGVITVKGETRSVCALYHNRDNVLTNIPVKGQAKAGRAQGGGSVLLLNNIASQSGTFLVLCSHSDGTEDSTTAALYRLSLSNGEITAETMTTNTGVAYSGSADAWNFQLNSGGLVVNGPTGQCRYGFISNLTSGSVEDITDEVVKGRVEVTADGVKGYISERADITVKRNTSILSEFKGSALEQIGDKFSFHWQPTERAEGLHLIRVFVHSKNGEIELSGSPQELVIQPKGVIYALNCCGQSYMSHSGIVYESDFNRTANYSADFSDGRQFTCLGQPKPLTSTPQIITGTHDGMLYAYHRSKPEGEHEHTFRYKISDLQNGDFHLRLHFSTTNPGSLQVNGRACADQVSVQLKKQTQWSDCYGFMAEIAVSISNNELSIEVTNSTLSAFCLLNKREHKEKIKSQTEEDEDEMERQKLSESLEPLKRTIMKKARKIVGWSQNLLVNASGESGDMSGWETDGNWNVSDGGHGTEKSFVTSFMECSKNQIVDLSLVFKEDYLDKAPAIQVSEWYREGCCGGGHYSFTAQLLGAEGNVIGEFATGRSDRLYKDNAWMQANHMFSDYGPGVRRVSITSTGQDDKYWGGHYGPFMSNAVVRVKREVVAAEGDAFVDVIQSAEQSAEGRTAKTDRIVVKLLEECKSMLVDHHQVNQEFQITDQLAHKKRELKKKYQKKREMRIFVSSTFRDFKGEREQLIKKIFPEVNH
ncbi:hypothetical protein CAPTEDRAFT_189472 [Capitella teleta]|uniref:FBA domain-containing protein n=1 Tax=Capitella teleta TaxID=283909 RepID=R7V1A8_CAPTE|nr:hypothetical protein CAPTEDRAFT_189472 [Capitella teleta]|eukprot:ELU12329.1 hypothetical protein CAPTEDRAFT_189472 [Capitella teleta]